jgi:hypothetical protein
VIISDKQNDLTILELLDLIKDDLKIIQTGYKDVCDVLDEIMEGKVAYEQVVQKDLRRILSHVLWTMTSTTSYNTLVLFENAIGIFNHKNKYKKLYKVVFKNRHQRFSIFINVHEIYTIPPAIRKNLKTLWKFGCMSGKQSFVLLFNRAFPYPAEKKDIIWENYKSLSPKQILLFTYDKNDTRLEIIK